MIPLTNKESMFYEEKEKYHTCQKSFVMIKMKTRNLKYIKYVS